MVPSRHSMVTSTKRARATMSPRRTKPHRVVLETDYGVIAAEGIKLLRGGRLVRSYLLQRHHHPNSSTRRIMGEVVQLRDMVLGIRGIRVLRGMGMGGMGEEVVLIGR